MVNSFLEESYHGDLEQSPHGKNTVNFLEQRHYGNLEQSQQVYLGQSTHYRFMHHAS